MSAGRIDNGDSKGFRRVRGVNGRGCRDLNYPFRQIIINCTGAALTYIFVMVYLLKDQIFCGNAKEQWQQNNECVKVLDDMHKDKKMAAKLPEWLVRHWGHSISDFKEKERRFPPFSTFVQFATEEAKIACEPALARLAQWEPKSTSTSSFLVCFLLLVCFCFFRWINLPS